MMNLKTANEMVQYWHASAGGRVIQGIRRIYGAVTDEHGDTSMIGGFISIAIMMVVGAYLLGTFMEVMPKLNNSNPFANLITQLSSTTNSAYSLLGIVLIVIAAVTILWYVRRVE